MIRIVLAEDQVMLRSALVSLLSLEEDFEIVGTADDGVQAQRLVRKFEPDILISDIEMPEMTGLELADRLVQERTKTNVIIITTFARPGYIKRARNSGVKGYILKDAPSDILADTIRKVAAGETVFVDADIDDELVDDPLIDRDRRLLRLVEQGKTNKEIAETQNLSVGTVRNYLNEVGSKLNATNRIEAFRIARDNGWL